MLSNKLGVSRKFLFSLSTIMLIGLLVCGWVGYTIGQSSPSSPLVLSGGVYPGAPSYTVWGEAGTYYAKNQYGAISFTSTNESYTFNSAVQALPKIWGGSIYLQSGLHILTSPVLVDRPLKISGAGRFSTYIVADGIDAFQVGTDNVTDPEFGNVGTFLINSLSIWGQIPTRNDAPYYGTTGLDYTIGSGIALLRGYQITIDDVFIGYKQYGISLSAPASGSIYTVLINNVEPEYNYYGIKTIGGFQGVIRITNCHSYLNQREGLSLSPSYSLYVTNYVSEADGWNYADNTGSCLYAAGSGDIYLTGIKVTGGKDAGLSPTASLIELTLADGASAQLTDITVQSGAHKGLYVWGGAGTYPVQFTMTNFLIGTLRDEGFMGDPGPISNWAFYGELAKGIYAISDGVIANATYGMTFVGSDNGRRVDRVYFETDLENGWSETSGTFSVSSNTFAQFNHNCANVGTASAISVAAFLDTTTNGTPITTVVASATQITIGFNQTGNYTGHWTAKYNP